MAESKLERYYKLKEDIETLDKFMNEYFISQERKDKKVWSAFEFRFSALKSEGGKSVLFKDINTFCKLLGESFTELKSELLMKTLDKMKKSLAGLKEEIKEECNTFLTNECGENNK